MSKKYIVELSDEYAVGGKVNMPVTIDGIHTSWIRTGIELTPYTEPDTQEAYQRGLDDAWEAARKIFSEITMHDAIELFGREAIEDYLLFTNFSASEAIEKIRQYEEEQEEQVLSGEIETWLAESDYTLDDIAEVLRKMRGEA